MNELTTYPISAADRAGTFAEIPLEHQTEIQAMLKVFFAVDQAPHKGKIQAWETAIRQANDAMAVAGLTTVYKRQTLYNLRAEWLKAGRDWAILVDRRKVPDWSTVDRRRAKQIPDETQQWWIQTCEQYKGRQNCQRQAWQRVCFIWGSTDRPIPGYETRPASGPDGVPEGWGYRNFCRLVERSKMIRIRAHTGARAAANYAFHIPTTRVKLEVGQYVMTDDVWHDMQVKPTIRSKPMRLLELCTLDLRSGKKVCYGLKPEVMDDETGVRQRLQERDMRFLVAAHLSLHGYRPDGTTFIGERGTAVIRDDVVRVLSDATDGAIRFEAGPIGGNPAIPGWYKPRGGGNPRFKAALESSFNLLHNAMAMLPGQTGSNERVNAPEELHGRKAADKELVKALHGLQLTNADQMMIRGPFLLLSQAQRLIDAMYRWIDGRTNHDLEGYEAAGLVTGEVRLDPRQPVWTPIYALSADRPDRQQAIQALMQIPGCYRIRRLSPAEVWEQDAGSLTRISMSVLPAILGKDLAIERRVNDHGSFQFEDSSVAAEALRYVGIAVSPRGHEVMLRDGETYLTFLNPFDARYLLVCDSGGGYIGRCVRVERADRADQEEMIDAMGQAGHVNALRSRAFLARNAGHAEGLAEEKAENARIIARGTIDPTPGPMGGEEAAAGTQEAAEVSRATTFDAGDRAAALERDGAEEGQEVFSAQQIAELLKT